LSINSREAQIGCEVINASGNALFPHTGCTTVEELGKIIRALEENAFLGRLYTAPSVYRMRKRLEELKIPKLPDLDSTFEDISKLSQIYIQEVARSLLRIIADIKDDSIVEKACQSFPSELEVVSEKWEENLEEKYKESEEEEEFEEESEEEVHNSKVAKPSVSVGNEETYEIVFEGVNSSDQQPEEPVFEEKSNFRFSHYLLFTKLAHRYLGGCLVAVKHPY
jgi:hypothetical protein